MGLIYVNPEGPGGNPDPLLSARDIKATFERMAMNHEETVALTAGGHTFGKAHGNGDPSTLGLRRRAATWPRRASAGSAARSMAASASIPSPAASKAAWVNTPTAWSENYFRLLIDYDYELVHSPAGAQQWQPIEPEGRGYGAGRAGTRPRRSRR